MREKKIVNVELMQSYIYCSHIYFSFNFKYSSRT